jgi:DNA replication initiation complex subunit (GINS family)
MKRMKKSAVVCFITASTMALNIPNVRLNAKGISHIPLHNRDINFTERSLFIPKMTIHQQNTILYNSLTLLFLNTDNNCFPFYNASNFWKNPYCSTGYTNTPSTFTTNKDNALTANGFVANCSSVAGITTYNPNVTTDANLTSFVPKNINNKIGNMSNNNVTGHNYNTINYNQVNAENYIGISSNSASIPTPTTTNGFPYKCIAIGGQNEDFGYSIIHTKDGGYAIAGWTNSFGAGKYDVYVVKLDKTWNLQWTRTIGGKYNDYGYSIIQTTDGGYAVAGATASYGAEIGNSDIYIVKLDGDGNIQWTRTIGDGYSDNGRSIIQTKDGGYAVVGKINGNVIFDDVYVVKLDGDGNIQWTRTIGGGEGEDCGNSIIQTKDGGYAVVGKTNSFGAENISIYGRIADDVYVVKLDDSGNIQWTRTIGGKFDDVGYSIIQTKDGGYAVAGVTASFSTGYGDVYIVKLDGLGNIQWTRTIGGSNGDDFGCSIIQTIDGGYAVGGWTACFGAGKTDVYIVKLDGDGNIQWTRTIGGEQDDGSFSIIQTTDGGYVVVGDTYSYGVGNGDVYIVKIDANGNLNNCPERCKVSSGGKAGTGGNVSSGGKAGSGGSVSSGGTAGSGGTLTNICP